MEEHDDILLGNSDNSEHSVKVYVRRGNESSSMNIDVDGQVDEIVEDCNNGDDVMVEVMGSDVFVDGVCSSGSRENSDNEEEAEVGHGERETGVVEFADSAITEIEVVREETVVVGRELVKSEEGGEKIVGDEGSVKGDIGITIDKVINCGNETVVTESSEVVLTTHRETSVVVEEKATTLVETNTDCVGEERTQKAGVSYDEVARSSTEADIVSLTTPQVESASVEALVEADLNTNHEVSAEVINISFVKNPILVADKVVAESQNDISTCADVESSYEQILIGYEVSEMHSNEVADEVDIKEALNDVEVSEECTHVSEACDIVTANDIKNATVSEVANQGTAITSVESQNQEQVIGSDTYVLDNDLVIDHPPSNLILSHEEDNLIAEVNDESCMMDIDHLIDSEQKDLKPEETMEEEDEKENVTDTTQSKTIDEEKITKRSLAKRANPTGAPQARYQLPTENEGEFAVSDLVWGKVRSHPWWPGQIFDSSDSSEKAMKFHKRDCFLVAYFGDQTFAWNDVSLLKKFKTHFSEIQKQSNSEGFISAVDCALEEIARRVELGLACSCISQNTYEKLKNQIVENTGIREESSTRTGVDKSTDANSFEPDKLAEYVRELARLPLGGADQLDIFIAKSQLLALYRLKGFHYLPEYQYFDGLVENTAETNFPEETKHELLSSAEENLKIQNSSSQKRKHNLKYIIYPRKKERSISEVMDGTMTTIDSPLDSFDDKQKSILLTQVHRPSFKIGDCISRVASQLTGPPSIRKINNDVFQKVDLVNHCGAHVNSSGIKRAIPTDYLPPQAMLPQLHLLGQDPTKGHDFLNTIVNFFSGFRNSVILGQYAITGNNLSANKVGSGRKRKGQLGSSGTFEFEDMKDSYWTDRVIQNGSEEQPLHQNQQIYQPLVLEPDQVSSRLNSRKIFNHCNNKVTGGNEKRPDLSPTELVLSFPFLDVVPSETKLTNMFRRFGPLKELETEIDYDTCRGRVIFHKCSDAEVAFSSASNFNIFGQIPVSYELKYYSPSVPFKAPTQDLEDAIAQDMEIAANEYLEDANVQYLEDVSIQYLEDGYIEDASMQLLEVAMYENLEDGGSHNLDVSLTQYLEDDTTVQTMIDVEVQNLECALYQNMRIAAEQILDDVTLQNLKQPNMEYATTKSLQVTTEDLGAMPQDLMVGTIKEREDVVRQNTETRQVEDPTAQVVSNVTIQDLEDATMVDTEGIEDTTSQEMQDITPPGIEDKTTEAMNGTI